MFIKTPVHDYFVSLKSPIPTGYEFMAEVIQN